MAGHLCYLDRFIRAIVGVALIVLAFGWLDGSVGFTVVCVGLYPVVTALLGICPIYTIFGITYCPTHRKVHRP